MHGLRGSESHAESSVPKSELIPATGRRRARLLQGVAPTAWSQRSSEPLEESMQKPLRLLLFVLPLMTLPRLAAAENQEGGVPALESELIALTEFVNIMSAELDATKNDLALTKASLAETKQELDDTKAELNGTKSDLQAAKALLDTTRAELDAKTGELNGKTAELDGKTAELNGKTAELDGKTAELNGKTAELVGKTAELDAKTAELDAKTATLTLEKVSQTELLSKEAVLREDLASKEELASQDTLLKEEIATKEAALRKELASKEEVTKVQEDASKNTFESLKKETASTLTQNLITDITSGGAVLPEAEAREVLDAALAAIAEYRTGADLEATEQIGLTAEWLASADRAEDEVNAALATLDAGGPVELTVVSDVLLMELAMIEESVAENLTLLDPQQQSDLVTLLSSVQRAYHETLNQILNNLRT